MFRNLNLDKTTSTFILKKNRYEDLCEIPNEYVKTVEFSLDTFSKINLEIPNSIVVNGVRREVLLYNMIKGRMYIIMQLNGTNLQFVIDDAIKVTDKGEYKLKTITGYSREKQLEKKSFIISKGLTRQLYRTPDETVEISDGILNIFEQQTTWKIGHVDQTAMKDTGLYNKWNEFAVTTNKTFSTVNTGTVIFDIDTPNLKLTERPVTFEVQFGGCKVYQNDKVSTEQNFEHLMEKLPGQVSHVKAVYTTSADHRFGITYTITVITKETGKTETITQEYEFDFINTTGLRLDVDYIIIKYDTGELEQTTITKYRYFEQTSTFWYSFLMNDVAEAYDCIFMFDSYNMIVNVYDKHNFGEFKGLYMNHDNCIEQITKTYKIGEVVSRLYVESPNTSIISENPLGTTYLENFDYYRKNGIMSTQLDAALSRYNALINIKQEEFLNLRLQKNSIDQKLSLAESELTSLNSKYKAATAVLTALVKANSGVKEDGTPKDPTQEQIKASERVEDLENQITAKLKEIDGLKTQQTAKQDEINGIATAIDKTTSADSQGKIFTQENLDELDDYVVEGSVTDNVYTTSFGLYNYYVKKLQDMNDVYIDFTIETKDFLKNIKHPFGWNYILSIGCKIALDKEQEELLADDGYIQLYGFTYVPKTQQINNLKFTNNKKPMSALKAIGDVGRQSSNTAYMTDFWKDTWKDAANNNTHVAELIKNGLDVAAQVVRGKGTVNKIDISESGIYVIDATEDGANDDKQVYIGSGLIAITTDRWKNAKLAIDANGVIANTLIGKVILGEQLFIGNGNNTLKIEPEGIYVYDNTAAHTLRVFIGIDQSDNMAKMALYSADGKNNLVLSEKGIYNCYQISDRDSFDYTNPFTAYFYIPENFDCENAFDARLIAEIDHFRAYSKTAKSTKINLTSTQFSEVISETSDESAEITADLKGRAGGTATGAASNVTVTSLQRDIEYTTAFPEGMESGGPFYEMHRHFFNASHNHTVNVTNGDHSHPVEISGTISAGKHRHEYKIPAHAHDIVMPEHDHPAIYGIYEHSAIPTVQVLIDGIVIATLNANNRSFNGEITNRFRELGSGTHNIQFRTSEGNGLARGQFTLYWSGFFNYD